MVSREERFMPSKANFDADELSQARRLRDRAATASELRRALSVLLIAEAGLDAKKASSVLGISERAVYRNRIVVRNREKASESINNARRRDGLELEVTPNVRGGRRNYLMTVQDEQDFLNSWETKARQGEIRSVNTIHTALEKHLMRSIPLRTTYRLLSRRGWRKTQLGANGPKSWRPPR
jgi:hypothetical protein